MEAKPTHHHTLHPGLRALAEQHIEATPSRLVAIFDVNGIYHFVSPAHFKLLGYTPDDLLGQHYSKVLLPSDVLQAQAASEDAFLTGTTTTSSLIRHKSGRLFTVKGNAQLYTDPVTGEHFLLSVSSIVED